MGARLQRDDQLVDQVGPYSLQALDRELAARGTSLPVVLGRLPRAEPVPRGFYDEGAGYPRAPLAGQLRAVRLPQSSGARAVTLDHLSQLDRCAFTRGAGLPGAWRLRVDVDMPSLARRAPRRPDDVPADGGAARAPGLTLDSAGIGRRVVTFSASTASVELTLVNAGHRYTCRGGTQYACQGGNPRDDDRGPRSRPPPSADAGGAAGAPAARRSAAGEALERARARPSGRWCATAGGSEACR